MGAVDVQISLRCGACGAVIPVNALVAEVTCWSCERRVALDEATWRLLLESPLREAGALAAGVEQSSALQTGVGVFHRIVRRADPICRGCGTALPSANVARLAAESGTPKTAPCPNCRHAVLVRPAPPIVAALGVVALAAESEAQLAGTTAKRAPVPLACTQCGGSLSVDGTQRTILCGYCSATQYLPDAVWISLRSTPVIRWSLVLAEGAARGPGAALATWSQLRDVIADPHGHLYGIGTPDLSLAGGAAAAEAREAILRAGPSASTFPTTIWSMNGDGTLRWQRTGLQLPLQVGLAWFPSGHLMVWSSGTAEVLQATDGATVYRFGADGPALGNVGAQSLTIDADGTIVWIGEGDALYRSGPRGEPIAMWGTGARKVPKRVNTNTGGTWVVAMGKKPTHATHAHLATGWDGRLWMQSDIPFDDACHLVSFDRAGKNARVASVPAPWHGLSARPAIDAAGTAYVLADHRVGGVSHGRHVFRLPAGAKQGQAFLAPLSNRGVLGDEPILAALPDGTLFTIGDEGRLRRFGANGAVQHISRASQAQGAG